MWCSLAQCPARGKQLVGISGRGCHVSFHREQALKDKEGNEIRGHLILTRGQMMKRAQYTQVEEVMEAVERDPETGPSLLLNSSQ